LEDIRKFWGISGNFGGYQEVLNRGYQEVLNRGGFLMQHATSPTGKIIKYSGKE
jgi:hypothetical protein